MAGSIAPAPKHQFFTNAGVVASGYKLFTYVSGSTTKQTTYTDSALSSANTNPIVLDSAGRATIFLPPGKGFKFLLTTPEDTDPPATSVWTVDNVNSVEDTNLNVDVPGTAGAVGLALGEACYLSDGSGGTTAGRWYRADSDNTYSSSAAIIGFPNAEIDDIGDTGSFRIAGRVGEGGLVGLTTGATYYVDANAGQITATPPTNARPVGVADSTTSIILSQYVDGARRVGGAWTFASTIAGANSIKSSHATAGVGYATGAGGTVTQQTDKSTGVTLDKIVGQITMNAATLNAAAEVSFTVTCSAVAATDVVIVNHASAGTAGAYLVGVSAVAAGSFGVTVANLSASNLGEAIVLNYAIIKGVGA